MQKFSDIFNLEDYLKQAEPERTQFLINFSKTQCFTFLIERTQECFREKNELAFFLEGIRLLIGRNEKALEKEISKVSAKLIQNYKKVSFIKY